MSQCIKCKFYNVTVEVMPEGYVHYAKATCLDCRIIWWLKKPKNRSKNMSDYDNKGITNNYIQEQLEWNQGEGVPWE